MKTKFVIAASLGLGLSLGACAGNRGSEELKPQYAPLPGQEVGEVLPVVNRSEVEPVYEAPKTVVVAAPKVANPWPVAVKPVRTLQMVTDSITAAWGNQLRAAELALNEAKANIATRQQEVVRLTARRPARPAGMLTAQVVDAALDAENRWQQDMAVANRAVAEAEQSARDKEGLRNKMLADREAAYVWARNSLGGQGAVLVEETEKLSTNSTLPVRRKKN